MAAPVESLLFLGAITSIIGFFLIMFVLWLYQEKWGESRFTRAVITEINHYFPFLHEKTVDRGGLRSDPIVVMVNPSSHHAIRQIEIEKYSYRVGRGTKSELKCAVMIRRSAARPEFSVIIQPESFRSAIFGGEDLLVKDLYIDDRLRFVTESPDHFYQYFNTDNKKFLRELAKITCFKDVRLEISSEGINFNFRGRRMGISHVKEFIGLVLLLAWHDTTVARSTGEKFVELPPRTPESESFSSFDSHPPQKLQEVSASENITVGKSLLRILQLLKDTAFDVAITSTRSLQVRPTMGMWEQVIFESQVEGEKEELFKITAVGKSIKSNSPVLVTFINKCLTEARSISQSSSFMMKGSECIDVEGKPDYVIKALKDEWGLLDLAAGLDLATSNPTIKVEASRENTTVTMVLEIKHSISIVQIMRFLNELSWFFEMKFM